MKSLEEEKCKEAVKLITVGLLPHTIRLVRLFFSDMLVRIQICKLDN